MGHGDFSSLKNRKVLRGGIFILYEYQSLQYSENDLRLIFIKFSRLIFSSLFLSDFSKISFTISII
ncbi:hypothetical protein BJP42_02330 [Candidatus Williamhamiltonella defendens]|nr:hypothetical protein BJP42_02330 [Candidatus Hamiltonella defensa]